MRLHLVNPNTTASMTAKAAAAARAVLPAGVELIADEPADGPPSIEGPYDAAFAVPGLPGRIGAAVTAGAAGHIIACFD
ncbi:Asp/Glu racemase, partial [Mycobacterium tuberculosis]|nr:Asp/Glu racemase [Mycobacterium tuberculosis]